MTRKVATRGNCAYCQRGFTRWGMTRHLQSCPQRQEAIAAVEGKRGRQSEIYHLLVQDAWRGDFWLHLEIPGKTKLDDLDNYLRAIWLECCGHLSAFTIRDRRYTQIFESGWHDEDEQDMDVRVDQVLAPDLVFEHEYDFGSTTQLKLQVVGVRAGKWSGRPIALMARNQLPDIACDVCGRPATSICTECLWSEAGWLFCDACLEEHECGEEMALPVVNSPRMGVCGYTGPAEPPY